MTSDSDIVCGTPPRARELVHLLLAATLKEGDLAIDATCGNGHDTLFLANQVGPTGRVLAFDIQEVAVTATRRLLEEHSLADRVKVFHRSHSELRGHTRSGSVAAILFNLGYLPGADRKVVTCTRTTLLAIDAASEMLRPGGYLSVIAYPGHDEGKEEAEVMEDWMTLRGFEGWRVARYATLGTLQPAPILFLAVKPD